MIHLKLSIVCFLAIASGEFFSASALVIDYDSVYDLFDQESSKPVQNPVPNKCKTRFDAAGVVQDEVMMFKGKYFWKVANSENATEIRSVWPELPTGMSHIDAIYEVTEQDSAKNTKSSRIWFFVGSEIYIFDGSKLELKLSLRDIGIDTKKYSKIDAIFRWPYNNQTYIFSGDDYWRLKGTKVSDGYPEKIKDVWAEVFQIDSAFSQEDELYFLKGKCYHKFDPVCMRMEIMKCEKVADAFFDCPKAPILNKSPKFDDVPTLDPEKCDEVEKNIEKTR